MEKIEVLKLLPFLSAFLQLAAAVMAVNYARRAFHRAGWLLLCGAFVLMFSRRVLGFLRLSGDGTGFLIAEELITLLTSLLVLAGVFVVGRSFGALVSMVEVEKKIKQEQEESFGFMHALFDCIPIPTFAVDAGGRVILWNRACERLTGIVRERLLGNRPDFSVLYPDKKNPPPTLAELLLTMTPEEIAERFKGAGVGVREGAVVVETGFTVEGAEKTVKLIAGRVYDEKGVIRGAIQTAQDITAERRMEQYVRTFQKIEAIGRLAVGVAHDFRNILAIIQAATELIPEEYRKDGTVKSCVAEIGRAVKRGSDLCSQLMRFAGTRDGEEKASPIFVNVVLVEWERMFRRLLRENIHLTLDISPDLWAVEASPGQIERIVTNLALNAQEAMPDGGSIVVRAENVRLSERDNIPGKELKAGRFVRLSVEDTGVGMDHEMLERIFEPFFTTKGRSGGLGLYVVYSEVRNLGGFIDVKSEPGQGTVFHIYLPAVRSVSADTDVPPGLSDDTGKLEAKGCVLLVEDEMPLREMLAEFLAKRGFEVHRAGDGREALEVFSRIRDQVDIIISDVMLPGEMNGCSLIEAILSQKKNVRVVLMTGYPSERVKRFADAECIETISKPFSMIDILKLLSRGERHEQTCSRNG